MARALVSKVWLVLAVAAMPAALMASSNGINGFTGQFGTDCNVCHDGGTAPLVTITGPTLVAPGTVHTYAMTIAIAGSTQRAGGLGVSNDGGAFLVVDPGTQLLAGEVAHTGPRPMDANREVVFAFNWQAPLSAGTYTLYGAGNAVNLGQGNNGDLASTATLTIDVVGATATPGETSGAGLAPLRVTGFDPATGEISISYGQPCEADDNNLYYGPLDQVAIHAYTGEVCGIGGTGAYSGFDPGGDSVFFLVVGRKGADEGSYGSELAVGGGTAERPPFAANVCGQTQALGDRCD